MGLSSALDWWEEWKLRILVLSSLLVHSFLFFSRYVRQWYALRMLRGLVWIAYIGGDALAIYALATLFNHQKQQTTADGGGNGNYAIEVIWAPFLLIHLGGQASISAYSLEDNELWKRHVITLASQVMVALYVFCKWWSGEKRLLKAAIFLFIVGILKFSQKPWALRRASYATITSTYLSSPSPKDDKSSFLSSLVRCCTTFRGQLREQSELEEQQSELEMQQSELEDQDQVWKDIKYPLVKYVEEAVNHVEEVKRREGCFLEDDCFLQDVYKMLVDLSSPYFVRLQNLKSFIHMDKENQNNKLWELINLQFSAIYTRVRSSDTSLSTWTFLLVVSLDIASLVLFTQSDMDGYNKSDITVTYILFYGTVMMEFAPSFIILLLRLLRHLCFPLQPPLHWQDMVAQHNIMSFCARKRKPPTLMKLATFSCLRDYINKHQYIWHKPEAHQISMLVRHHAEDGWKEYICDVATYRRFNNLRGEHTLRKHHLLEQDKLGWTFYQQFDEYVLLWHIATDLCLHHTSSSTNNTTTASSSQSQDTIKSRRSSSEIISNYMIYLLFICPDMLIPGTRYDLFMLACDEIESMINESPLSLPDETRNGIAQWILGMEQGDQRMTKAPKISDALHKLARVLIDDLNEEQRWKVIQGVWVEMLCYSASRCRGYLHAQSLGVAAEFLTNVWLLWWCMGMQTLPDMVHNPGPPEELTAAASV